LTVISRFWSPDIASRHPLPLSTPGQTIFVSVLLGWLCLALIGTITAPGHSRLHFRYSESLSSFRNGTVRRWIFGITNRKAKCEQFWNDHWEGSTTLNTIREKVNRKNR
jgi:hypothetical protein